MANLASGQKITPQRSRGYQAGTATVNITASTNGSVNVAFPTAFSATPAFAATIVGGAGTLIRATIFATSVSATGATIRVDLNASSTIAVTVHWIAAEQ